MNSKIIIYLTLFFLLGNSILSKAVTAYPQPIEFIQPDGSSINIQLRGDERVKWALSLDGYSLLFNKDGFYEYAIVTSSGEMKPSGIKANNPDQRTVIEKAFLNNISKGLFFNLDQLALMRAFANIEKMEGEKSFPTTGNRKLVCILIGFTDKPFIKTQTDFNNLFNQIGYSAGGATGSVKDYYLENSYNQFDLTVTVAGPYTANNNMAYYGANDGSGNDIRPRELVTEAVQKANPDVNYAEFDNDNDGSVDGVYVIFAGFGEEAGASTNAIWSHAWNIPSITLDGKTISKYSCSPELRGTSGTTITAIGVICHEFGHVMGAPDYYDTDYSGSGGEFEGTGNWDMMAGGSWNNNGVTPAHHNAFTKIYKYNWASPTVLNSATSVTLQNSVQNSTSFYRFNTPTNNEYYLIENRQKINFDASIPGHGLIIYHVHANMMASTSGINTGHPQKMYPVCASAPSDPTSSVSSYGNINSAGCPMPGSSSQTSFTDLTVPSTKSWAGANTNKPLTNIVENNTSKTVSFDFMGGGLENPVNFQAVASGSSQIALSWTKNSNNNDVLILVNTSNTFGTPANGTNYITGTIVSGGGTVIFNGSEVQFLHQNLNPSTVYYYMAFSKTAANVYSSGSFSQASTSCGSLQLPFTENFNTSGFPSCWTQQNEGSGLTDRWSVSATNLAGGTANEMKASYQQVSPATSRLVTPPLNTLAYQQITLSFKHMLDDYAAGVTLKIQSSVNGVNWTDESWSLASAGNTNVGPNTINLNITNNLNSPNTFLAFTLTGNLYNIDYWYIDNVSVTGVLAPVANFIASPLETNIGQNINFNSTSTGTITSYEWNFGQGANPVSVTGAGPHNVSYSTSGYKTVSLTINGTSTETKNNYIKINNPDFNSPQSLTINSLGLIATLSWQAPSVKALGYFYIYRDGVKIDSTLNASILNYTDTVPQAGNYSYFITAAYISPNGESGPSNLLNVSLQPPVTYTLVISTSGNGYTTPSAGSYSYVAGETESVVLTATPDANWLFSKWIINGTDYSQNPYTLAITGNSTAVAVFIPVNYSLNISATGSGACIPVVGQHSYSAGEMVNLTAYPAMGWQFAKWIINGTDFTQNPYSFSISQNTTAVAVFQQITYQVNVSVTGSGSTSPEPGTHTFNSGQSVTFTSTPDTGWEFEKWTINGFEIFQNPYTATITQNSAVVAIFHQITHTLEMIIQGQGQTQPGEGQHNFNYGDTVNLVASPANGWKFVKWIIGSGEIFENPLEILLISNYTVTAVFEVQNAIISPVQHNLMLYPNPASNSTTVQTSEFISKIQIFNLIGEQVKEIFVEKNGPYTLSTENLSKGVYVLKVELAGGVKRSVRLVKNQ